MAKLGFLYLDGVHCCYCCCCCFAGTLEKELFNESLSMGGFNWSLCTHCLIVESIDGMKIIIFCSVCAMNSMLCRTFFCSCCFFVFVFMLLIVWFFRFFFCLYAAYCLVLFFSFLFFSGSWFLFVMMEKKKGFDEE